LKNLKYQIIKKYNFPIFFLIILLLQQIIFLKFFPDNFNTLGHDYEQFLPNFIFGKIWFENNFLSVPWFTPSFCCGIPFFADPQSMFYSVQQIFFIFFEPLVAVKLMFLYFSIVAYVGMFLLLKQSFSLDKFVALLGASLFLFNGFFTYRAVVGHVAYLSYVFIPIFCYFLIKSSQSQNKFLIRIFILIASLIFASFIHSGSGPIMPLIFSSIIFILLSYYFHTSDKLVFKNFFIILFLGLLIALSKISASLYFLSEFSREYPFLYFNNILDYFQIAFTSLFFYPEVNLFNQLAVNKVVKILLVHEIEYGISIIPLLVLIFFIRQIKNFEIKKSIFYLFVFIVVMLPILFNVNFYFFSDLLKQLPLIKSTWVQVRWTAFYIIPIIFFTVFVLNKITFYKKKNYLISFFMVVLILQVFLYNKNSYLDRALQHYNPVNMSIFFDKLNSKDFKPKIVGTATMFIPSAIAGTGTDEDISTDSIAMEKRNDHFANSYSAQFCYQPIFGYGWESFPWQNLKFYFRSKITSSILDEDRGKDLLYAGLSSSSEANPQYYNIFNPSCFLFPNENNCRPGDLFKVSQKEDLDKFVNYKKFDFKLSKTQHAANYLSLFSFIFAIIFLIINSFFYFKGKIKKIKKS
jgi:hypothetical protein